MTLSYNEKSNLVSAAINNKIRSETGKQYTYAWIREMYDGYAIFTNDSEQKIYQVDYAILGTDVTLGDFIEVIEQRTYTPVVSSFAVDLSIASFSQVNDDMIEVSGKIFEIGNFPDKDFSLSLEEAQQAIKSFAVAPLDYEHVPGPLDGKLGELTGVWLGDDNKSIFGKAQMPTWLHKALDSASIKVSATWDRATKQIKALAIVNNPRISDAALVAAFAGSRHSSKDQKDLQDMHDLSVSLGAMCGNAKMNNENSNQTMSIKEKIYRAVFKVKDTESVQDQKKHEDEKMPDNDQQNTQNVDFAAKIAELEKQVKDQKIKAWKAEAESFADKMISSFHAMPHERDLIVAQFLQAATDDDSTPATITFNIGTEQKSGSRVDAFKAAHEARTAHKELSQESTFTMLGSDGKSSAEDEAELNELRKMTPLGKATISK